MTQTDATPEDPSDEGSTARASTGATDAATAGSGRSNAPEAALRVILHLSYLRSVFAVGQALWVEYPDEASWLEAFKNPEFMNAVVAFADLVVAESVDFGQAMVVIEPFARTIGADPVDLLAVLRTHFNRSQT